MDKKNEKTAEMQQYAEWLGEIQDLLTGIEPKEDWNEPILSAIRRLGKIKYYLRNSV